jgi:hypothetical protein
VNPANHASLLCEVIVFAATFFPNNKGFAHSTIPVIITIPSGIAINLDETIFIKNTKLSRIKDY